MKVVLRLLPVIATRRTLFLETVVWSVVAQAAALGITLGLALVVGHALAGAPLPFGATGAALVGLAVVAALAVWRESWVSHDLAYRLIGFLRDRVFASLRRALPMRSQARRTGDLVTTVMADIETLEWLYAHTAAQTLSALLVLAVSVAVSVLVTPLLLVVWIPLLVLGVAVPLLTVRRARQDSDRLADGAATLRSELLDTVRGMRELNGSGRLAAQLDRLTDDTRALARLQTREASRIGAERGIAHVLLALAVLGAVAVITLERGAVPPELVPLAVSVGVAGLGPAAQIADLFRSAGTLRSAAERITAVLEQPPSVPDANPHPPAPRAGEDGLVFERVTFAYDADDRAPVLDGFSVHVRPGEIVALTGPSGAGKTTVAQLALRMWDPDAGVVRIDGVDLRDLTDDELRARISTVPQSSPLLRGTIRTNITLGAPATADPVIERVAASVGLLDPATGLPAGLDTPVGEHGAGLSGGQRARVALARALLVDPRVLILDEPTASLDPDADAAIMEFLRHRRHCAILLIAHRRETIAAADRVVDIRTVQ